MVRPFYFVTILGVAFTVAAFQGQGNEEAATSTAGKPGKPASAKAKEVASRDDISKALGKRITVHFEKTALESVLAEIAKQTGVQIVLSEPYCQEQGIDPEFPVTFRAKQWRGAFLLTVIGEQFGLTWVRDNGFVHVLPEVIAADDLQTRVFDVEELLIYERTHRPRLVRAQSAGIWFRQASAFTRTQRPTDCNDGARLRPADLAGQG